MPDRGDPHDAGEIPDRRDMPDAGEMPDRGDMPDKGDMSDRGRIPDRGKMPGNDGTGRLPGASSHRNKGGDFPFSVFSAVSVIA